MTWIINTLNSISSQFQLDSFDSKLEEWTKWIIARTNSSIHNNTKLFVNDYLLSDERDINNQIDLESEEDLLNDLVSYLPLINISTIEHKSQNRLTKI